jgi:RIO kinase 1
MFYEGVLLMELVKDDEGRPAPRLIDVSLEPGAALRIYADLLAQMIAMLCCDLIHGDLSPYNILAAADGPTIIDFPQVISAVHSSRAEFFFLRDFDNVVRFVSGFDPALAIHRHDGRAIWRAYVSRELTREFVPPPPPPPSQPRGGGPNRWADRRDQRGPRQDDRRGDGRQARPQDPGRTGGAPRDDRPPQGDPRRPSGPPQGSSGPDARRYPGSDPRSQDPRRSTRSPQDRTAPRAPDAQSRGEPSRPRQDQPGAPQRPYPDPRRPQPELAQRRAPDRPSNDRGAAGQPQRPPSREWSNPSPSPSPSPSSPAPARGRRRRPKRHW